MQRAIEIKQMEDLLSKDKSSFLAVTGRRRVGKTYLINHVYKNNFCFKVTGIQNGDQDAQIVNFIQKLAEYSNLPIVEAPSNWQLTFALLKSYLRTLPSDKKQVLFIDELPWVATARSGFIQLFAHLWNDYLSTQKHFIVVICGSATSWITNKVLNDKGGFHNRVTDVIKLMPFTLSETKQFLLSNKINLSDDAMLEIYMAMGGIPFYLEHIQKGESASAAIERLCFSVQGILKNEYDNLYKALFNYPENHEAIIKALATSKKGLTRDELIKKSKVEAGGPYTRSMSDLLLSGFIVEETPYGKKKRGATYRLVDEYSVFYHKFIAPNKKQTKGIWAILSASQQYKIWSGYAFETLCMKHIDKIKSALGILNVYTETSSFSHAGNQYTKGFQIDVVIDRRDKTINLCECKYYDATITISKDYAKHLKERKGLFRGATKTKKTIFTTLISNGKLIKNEHSLDAIDDYVSVEKLFE